MGSVAAQRAETRASSHARPCDDRLDLAAHGANAHAVRAAADVGRDGHFRTHERALDIPIPRLPHAPHRADAVRSIQAVILNIVDAVARRSIYDRQLRIAVRMQPTRHNGDVSKATRQ
ncbi:hypothetical protein [Burkholderia diffusa]|uniref:hypothetical protein n=1 Tax=Burkholderia diffusa TaxID=488732 RepID=UPI001248D255|nr:hypothetical protein [Burkholderia diffusa]KAB0661610.1 hypothetical protein F7R23_05450 [Burkholderia diffusa]MBM2655975.1 hypothetical protein [Burkholderia diffusa]